MITIAVDAMGGDHAPRPEVEGSVLAARELNVRVLLVGQPNPVRAELAKHSVPNLPIEIMPAAGDGSGRSPGAVVSRQAGELVAGLGALVPAHVGSQGAQPGKHGGRVTTSQLYPAF